MADYFSQKNNKKEQDTDSSAHGFIEQPKKVSWLKKLLFAQPEVDEQQLHYNAQSQTRQQASQSEKVNKQIAEIVSQLDDKADQRNSMLMQTLETLRVNNESLLQQIQNLSQVNKQLYDKVITSNKRARIFKVVALLASMTTIVVGLMKILGYI
ncbi:MAG: hypothetical protein LBU60_05620 [Clostridiales bacterium]|jgi:uncharacterized membrane protein|nr:hypothetical protein [Clostridiales bacterium]